MIRIEVFDQARRRWAEVPNGPFPLTRAQLDAARALYQEEWARTPDLSGVRVSPQTTARALLKQVAPALSDFDCGMVGFAVSNARIRTTDDDEGGGVDSFGRRWARQ